MLWRHATSASAKEDTVKQATWGFGRVRWDGSEDGVRAGVSAGGSLGEHYALGLSLAFDGLGPLFKSQIQGWEMAQSVIRSLCKHEELSVHGQHLWEKPGLEAEAGGSGRLAGQRI